MIFNNKKVKEVINYCFKYYPEYTYHLDSRLTCLRYERQVAKCTEVIPKNAKVLDLGCGLGHISMILSIARPDLDIIGIDRTKAPLWKKIKFKCKFEKGDALNLRFKDNTFDVVISFGVMEHTNNDKKFLKEIYRVLKFNGINLMFNLPNKYSMNEFFAKILETCHENKYTKKQIKNLFLDTGFRDIEIKRESFLPAQFNEVSRFLGNVTNKYHRLIDRIDRILIKTPLNLIAEAYYITSRK